MIYGDRIRFRAPEQEDLPVFVRWLNDPEVRAGISLYLPMSLANEEKWFRSMLERPQDEHPMCIECKEEGGWKLIGNCGFFEAQPIVRSAEFGIMIGEKDYWNKGYGTEAVQLLIKHGFETLNLNRISLRVFETNPGAIRSYEKAGFIQEGSHRQEHYQDGRFIDVIHMSILRSEWDDTDKQ
ncbi:MAG: GNAT family N-acetyltransferase [Anaerolineae bacterium]|nr:GNAT family N-acetyltransferase [Anaerolineae bacterium]